MKFYKALIVFSLCLFANAQVVFNVKAQAYNAIGNSIVDDTAAIQKAINAASLTNGTVLIPSGVYMINPTAANGRGLVIAAPMSLVMAPGAVLKALPSAAKSYAILAIVGTQNVTISGGILEGERSNHIGTAGGEWGHGMSILNSKNVSVIGTISRECWGDGFYIATSSQAALYGVTADHNRRQGLSITSVDGMIVADSTFKNTSGTLPEDGIDVEPNQGETSKNILIKNCTIIGNSGFGLEVGVPLSYTGKAWIVNFRAEDNIVTGNGVRTLSKDNRAGMEISNTSGHIFVNNYVKNNLGCGILLRNSANSNIINKNIVDLNGEDGIQQYLCIDNIVSENIITNNGKHGIYSPSSTGITSPNAVSGNKL